MMCDRGLCTEEVPQVIAVRWYRKRRHFRRHQ